MSTAAERPGLADLQAWLSIVMRHPGLASDAVRARSARARFPLAAVLAGAIVKPNERMTVTDRLQVYNSGYLARLYDVLSEDYPVLRAHLGEDAFHRLCAAYVARHPSRHPNLNQLGKHLPVFVARQHDLPSVAFAAELATLERRISDAFDAPEFAPIGEERLRAVAPDAWARARLACNPSLRLEAFRYPVNAYYIARREGASPSRPRPRRSHVAIFRQGGHVYRRELEPTAFAVLAALASGETLGRALERAGAAELVGGWFQTWAGDGLFVDVRVGRRA
ncbi:MAG: DNA-binding domain-containing protein [Planctomycetota bacterium]